MWHSRL